MIPTAIIIPLLLNALSDAKPTRMEHMTISKMRMADLESSASGYVYNQQQGFPVSYVQYTNHGSGRYYHAPDTVHYVVGVPAPVAPPVPETAPRYEPTVVAYATAKSIPGAEEGSYEKEEIANYANEPLSKYASPVGSIKPDVGYYVSKNVEDEQKDEQVEKTQVDVKDDEEDDGNDDDEDEEDEEDDEEDDSNNDFNVSRKNFKFDGSYSPGNVGGFEAAEKVFKGGPQADESSYEAGEGEKYDEEKFAEYKEKGDDGYKNEREFNKGEEGRHDNGIQQGYYKLKHGDQKEHIDSASKYGSSNEEEKGEEGDNYEHKKYHKKGQKTNGFHNIYHKDEYKKDTDFYDDDHKEGHFDKYENAKQHHNSAEGGFKKGGHQVSNFDDQNRGKKGHFDKGHYEDEESGHEEEEDEKSFYKNNEDYATQKGSNSDKAHKYSRRHR